MLGKQPTNITPFSIHITSLDSSALLRSGGLWPQLWTIYLSWLFYHVEVQRTALRTGNDIQAKCYCLVIYFFKIAWPSQLLCHLSSSRLAASPKELLKKQNRVPGGGCKPMIDLCFDESVSILPCQTYKGHTEETRSFSLKPKKSKLEL